MIIIEHIIDRLSNYLREKRGNPLPLSFPHRTIDNTANSRSAKHAENVRTRERPCIGMLKCVCLTLPIILSLLLSEFISITVFVG